MTQQLTKLHTVNASWKSCFGCGTWQLYDGKAVCLHCTFDMACGQNQRPEVLRFLLRLDFQKPKQPRVEGIYTERLQDLEHDELLKKSLEDELYQEWQNGYDQLFPCLQIFRHSAHTKLLNKLKEHLPDDLRPHISDDDIHVSMLVMNADTPTGVDIAKRSEDWLQARSKSDTVLEIIRRSSLDFRRISYQVVQTPSIHDARLKITVHPQQHVKIVKAEVTDSVGHVMFKEEMNVIVENSHSATVLDITLPMHLLWEHATRAELRTGNAPQDLSVKFTYEHGLKNTRTRHETKVPLGDLGTGKSVAVYIDLGSMFTKYVRAPEGSIQNTHGHVNQTKSVTARTWNIPAYQKQEFLQDATGRAWSEWTALLIAALQKDLAKDDGSYLDTVILSLPSIGSQLTIETLKKGIEARWDENSIISDHLDLNSLIRALNNLTIGKTNRTGIRLISEHEALFHHYGVPLQSLKHIAETYYRKQRESEQAAEEAISRRNSWMIEKSRHDSYQRKGVLRKLWTNFWGDIPPPPGSEPQTKKALEKISPLFYRLILSKDILSHVIILDVGGFTLDVAAIENNKLVPQLSKSFEAGGEQLTQSLDLLLSESKLLGAGNTAEQIKLDLGKRISFRNGSLHTDPGLNKHYQQLLACYEKASKTLYHSTIEKIATDFTSYIKHGSAKTPSSFTLILTGGGAMNPYFSAICHQVFTTTGLKIQIVDALILENLTKAIPTSFNSKKDRESLKRFETIWGWAKANEHSVYIYDKFAVLGGMIQETGQ